MSELELLMKHSDARITIGHKWLVWNEEQGWTVYEHKPYARHTIVIIATPNLRDAITELQK